MRDVDTKVESICCTVTGTVGCAAHCAGCQQVNKLTAEGQNWTVCVSTAGLPSPPPPCRCSEAAPPSPHTMLFSIGHAS
jgi:hypothetical protein